VVLCIMLCLVALNGGALNRDGPPLPKDDGYRGIWYSNQPTKDEYRYKYSGGMATYPQQHIPIAYYAKEVNKTFFVYGGVAKGKNELLHMVSYYDHVTGLVPRPTILLNKKTDDAHDNPTLMLDDKGYLWVFSNSHGTARPSYVHRSKRPFSVDEFEQVLTTNFSYSQPWFLRGRGFLFLHTRYGSNSSRGIRNLYWMTSPDGRQWGEPQLLANFGMGHYQISWREGTRLATAFDYHPRPVGLNARTNIYYLETSDQGKSWRTVAGKQVETPLVETQNIALVHNYQVEGLLVYLKDLQFDAQGRPIILFLTSKGYESGPANNPRTWRTARWTGQKWEIHSITTSTNNYDHGSIYIEGDREWRIIAPTQPGPQAYNPGGEMALWVSPDQGQTWRLVKQLTRESERNHTYARRPVNAHPDFYAIWADGNAREPSESSLYFTNRDGDRVWRLPPKMNSDFVQPEVMRWDVK
jgi:BNR repeat-containing family member